MTSFQLVGLSIEPFAPLFDLSDVRLAELGAQRVVATEKPGYPCRVSLADAEVGDELLLLPYLHQAANSPYRASGPIYVRKGACQRHVEAGVVPEYVRLRLISVRAYDATHMMVAADVCDGNDIASALEQMFSNGQIAYVHLHNAKRGCFSCLVNRV